MEWFVDWFLRSYLLQMATQGGAIVVAAMFLGLTGELNEFFKAHKALGALVLVVHFLMYLLTALTSVDRDRLDEVGRRHLEDD